MELSTIKNPRLVVALDIGSTYSGYAWQWRKGGEINPSNVEFNTNWGVGSLQLLKTSTSLLLKEDRTVDSFGYQAEKRYSNYSDRKEDSYYLFRRFKLRLYDPNDASSLDVEAVNGATFTLMEVMSKFIAAMKDHFLDMMKDKNQTVVSKQTLWVITVPAIWTERARDFMRVAALEAGIEPHNLLLALEPEAASIYCLNEVFSAHDFGTHGKKFMTVDLGGGTVDMTAFEVLGDGFLKEICSGTGKCAGGQDVNDAFFQNWKEAFRDQDWNSIHLTHTFEDVFKMETEFESNKVQIGSSREDEFIKLPIPETTRDLLNNNEIQLIDSDDVRKFFQIQQRAFVFNSELVRKCLFKVATEKIVEPIMNLLSKNEHIKFDTIVFVGGFSESKIVIDELKKILKQKYSHLSFITPTSPFRAVLCGAVLYGHNPRIFRSRISRKTYGVRTSSYFDPEKHDPARMYVDPLDGEEYIRGIFDVHVRKGSSVSLNDEQPCVIYYPKREDAKRVRIQIYSSDENCPEFTSDAGCQKEGEIIVDLPETRDDKEREIVVGMIYGGTQLDVVAREGSTNFNATIKFN